MTIGSSLIATPELRAAGWHAGAVVRELVRRASRRAPGARRRDRARRCSPSPRPVSSARLREYEHARQVAGGEDGGDDGRARHRSTRRRGGRRRRRSARPRENARPAAPPSCSAACSAPAIEDDAASRADAGITSRASSRWLLYCDAAMLPSTATPSAAPSSRVASFIADPAPARRCGTADMIAAVIGDIDMAMPAVSVKIATRMNQ